MILFLGGQYGAFYDSELGGGKRKEKMVWKFVFDKWVTKLPVFMQF